MRISSLCFNPSTSAFKVVYSLPSSTTFRSNSCNVASIFANSFFRGVISLFEESCVGVLVLTGAATTETEGTAAGLTSTFERWMMFRLMITSGDRSEEPGLVEELNLSNSCVAFK